LHTTDLGEQTDAFTYTYAANNLQATAQSSAGALTTAWYDADDQRVRKILGDGDSTYYLRGPLGVLSEFAGSGDLIGWSVDYIYVGGRLIATTKPPVGAWRSLKVTPYGGPGTVTSSPTGISCGSSW
jgi:hypothetical protein